VARATRGFFNLSERVITQIPHPSQLASARKAKATTRVEELSVTSANKAAEANDHHASLFATEAKGFPFLTWRGRKCQEYLAN